MSSKALVINWLSVRGRNWVFLAAFLLSAGGAWAGDPIQFSSEKGKQGPQQERKVENDPFKGWRKDANPNPLSGITPYIPSRPIDPKDTKRLKKEREDRKNWLLRDPTDEKEDEDEPFSSREYSLDGIEKDEDYNATFTPLMRQKTPGKNRANVNQQSVVTESEDSDVRDAKRSPDGLGSHTARELNLKDLFDTSQTGPARGGNSEPSLFEFLRENAAPKLSRDQVARKEQFEKFLNASPSDPMQPRMVDPINFAPDLTQQRMNPVLPSAGPSAFDVPSGPRQPDFSPKADFNANPWRATMEVRPSSPTPFQTPLNPNAPNARPSVNGGSMFNNNVQKRPGL